jgi:hypothetical protein
VWIEWKGGGKRERDTHTDLEREKN